MKLPLHCSAPFCERLITLFTLSSIRCNKYLDSSWSQQEQWIYIPSWKLIYAPTLSKNVEVSRIFVGVLSEWILLLFLEADGHSIWHSTLYTTLYTTAKKTKQTTTQQSKSNLSNNPKPAVVVLFTGPTMFGQLTDWTLLNSCGIILIHNLVEFQPTSLDCHVTELRCIPEFGGWGALW